MRQSRGGKKEPPLPGGQRGRMGVRQPQGPGMRRGHGPGSVTIESPRNFKKALARLFRYFGAQTVLIVIAAVLIIGNAVFHSIAPAVIGNAINNYIERSLNIGLFAHQMVILLGIYIGAWIAQGLSGILITRIANTVVFRLRNETFAHIQKLSMSYFDKRGIGDIISRLTNDIEMIYNAMTQVIGNLIGGVFSIVGVLIAMFIMNLQLSFLVLGTVPVMVILTAIIGSKVRAAFRKNQAQIGLLNANIQESVSAVKVIQTFNRQREEHKKFDAINDGARKIGSKAEFTSYIFMPIMTFMTSLTLALIIGVGGTLVLTRGGIFSIGLLTAFILYARRFFMPLRQITSVYNVLQSALAGVERVFDILETRPGIENRQDAVVLDDIHGEVEFKDVSFAYVEEKSVLENISLKAEKGQVVAIVGPTGAGKTTIVNLLSRFYDVAGGRIMVDGNDIRDLNIDSLRTKMGVVLQESFFFAMSIRENLLYGNPNASEKQMIEAAKMANADHFIRRLPRGYDTVLSERGMNLSQGERQLLGIARAILADPKILILDEATSNIDSLTEINIQKGLLELMKDRTSFIIAHRLSTVKNADKVLVVHDKRIIEEGTHQELMDKGGFYSRLYRMQRTKVEITEDMDI